MQPRKVLCLLLAGMLSAAIVTCEEGDFADQDSEDADDEESNETESMGPAEEDGVVVLTQDNFNEFIADTETVLVEFYAPWCGHCKQLAPEYSAAAKELKQMDPPVILAKVDATQEEDLAQEHEVSGYPTLKFFKNAASYEYDGPRNKAGIVDYMKKRADPTWKPDPEAVQVLTMENFTDTIQREKLLLVEFYAPWCGHCKNLAPKYEKAAKRLLAAPEPIMLAKVDATAETDLASMYDVKSYPTLKIFREGRVFDYKGPRDEHGIVSHMQGQQGEPAKEVDDLKALNGVFPEDDILVLGVFASTDDPQYRIFQDALQDMREQYRLAYTMSEEVTTKYKSKPNSVLVLMPERYWTKYEAGWRFFDIQEQTTPEEIQKFIKEYELPLVGSYDSLRERYSKRSPLCVAFYTVDWSFDHRGATQMWRKKITEIATRYRDITFAIADEENSSQLFKELGLDESGEELNMGCVADGKKYPMDPMEEYDADHIKDFLDKFKRGEIAPRLKSQPVPKKQQGPVTVVVGNTFDKIVRDTGKDVLIEMYAPWCGHCKKLEPVYKELAKKFKPVKNLVIAKVDATANDVPDDYKAEGFPTIYWAPSDNKDHPVKYDGGREMEDFVSFIKEKATVSLSGLKDEL